MQRSIAAGTAGAADRFPPLSLEILVLFLGAGEGLYLGRITPSLGIKDPYPGRLAPSCVCLPGVASRQRKKESSSSSTHSAQVLPQVLQIHALISFWLGGCTKQL